MQHINPVDSAADGDSIAGGGLYPKGGEVPAKLQLRVLRNEFALGQLQLQVPDELAGRGTHAAQAVALPAGEGVNAAKVFGGVDLYQPGDKGLQIIIRPPGALRLWL